MFIRYIVREQLLELQGLEFSLYFLLRLTLCQSIMLLAGLRPLPSHSDTLSISAAATVLGEPYVNISPALGNSVQSRVRQPFSVDVSIRFTLCKPYIISKMYF